MKSTRAAVLALVLGVAGGASASTVRFKFAGTIDELSGIQGPVILGDPFTVAYEFDSTTPDSDPAPNVGNYLETINFVEGFVGNHNVSYDVGDIFVLDNGFAGDSYGAMISNPISSITFSLTNLGGGALNGDGLPLDLVIKEWQIRRFTIHVDIGPTFWEASGFITDFSSEILPDPCYPDCNLDRNLSIADFACFQAAFAQQQPYADCNNSGSFTIADFGCFQSAFAQGCP